MTERLAITAAGVVFDLDDTLYLERDFARSGFAAVGARFGDRFDGEAFVRHCNALFDAGVRGQVFDAALARLGIAPEAELIAQLVAAYREHLPQIALCADAARFLQRIGPVPTGLVSDGPAPTQTAKVRALGLDARIDHVILTGTWPDGFGKPHPRAFEAIEAAMGLAGSALVYIADNAAKDFLAPNRRGWQTVQILRDGRVHDGAPATPEHAADHRIATLDAIDWRPGPA